MSNDAPIGMFDSGIGGLTIAKALLQRLPMESLCYVGDTAHMPYGDKSPERLKAYAVGIAQRLLDRGCKALVVACNSASSNALDEVRDLVGPDIPVIDVVQPVVDAASLHHPHGELALIGTRATVQSGLYERLLSAQGLTVTSRATPLLAGAIEEGFTMAPSQVQLWRLTSPMDGRRTKTPCCSHARTTLWWWMKFVRSCPGGWRCWMLLELWRNGWRPSWRRARPCRLPRRQRGNLRSPIGPNPLQTVRHILGTSVDLVEAPWPEVL